MFFVVGPGREYGPAEIEITTELSRRVALAISNGQIHAAEQAARRSAEASAERVARLQRVTRGLGAAMTRDAVAIARRPRGPSGPRRQRGTRRRSARTTRSSSSRATATTRGWLPPTRARRWPRAIRWPGQRASRSRSGCPDIRAAEADDDRTRTAFEQSANRSLCAVPLDRGRHHIRRDRTVVRRVAAVRRRRSGAHRRLRRPVRPGPGPGRTDAYPRAARHGPRVAAGSPRDAPPAVAGRTR